MANTETYYNEFFEGVPKLTGEDLKIWLEENRKKKKTFKEFPCVKNLTTRDMWGNRAKFYFLPFLINCYKFTRQHNLPHFAIPCSPTFLFYRDRLHLRNFPGTIHNAFFECLDMCIPKGEWIMLLIEKRFHVTKPVDGGTQQLYNMLWDYDLSPIANKVLLPKPVSSTKTQRLGIVGESDTDYSTYWNINDLNPDMPESGIDLCRKTCWLIDDLEFLGKRYYVKEQKSYDEIVDISKYPEDKQQIWAKTAREFIFQLFEPKDMGDEEDDAVSSGSDLDDYDGFDSDDTELADLDSTLDFDEEDSEMNKIVAFFAKMPKVTGLVQGMLDMMTSLTRVLPLVAVKIDDPKLKDSIGKTTEIISLGINKVLKICAYLGIKVERKPNGAIWQIVKNRFKKDKKDFLEYEIDELNKSLDALENVDGDKQVDKPLKGQIPLDVKPNHLYPQKMPLRPTPPPPIVVPPEPPPVPVKPPHPHPPHPHPPHPPPKPDDDSSSSELKPEPPSPPPIPSVMPEPPNKPPKGENGIK